ncbi:C-type lectin (CTL) or carbohydrate-recognition domain (CRD) [Desmophyllum pertusum]|uniref:C-type lectin (CTL) or carbohydrate-recognition domain (CRD) n=1 Tax=Desmophyllum pertusum TaxID=174260 RepID=A0A9W9Z2H5_9CNID|nr:C-type lectin (CTL) or carbohydrate-recognition domain (CRD) [Desmophyllum pertusum]
MSKNLVFLTFLVVLLTGITCAFQPVTENSHVLVGHVFQQLYSRDWFSCIQVCQDEPRCISYNYERSARANGQCELNDCGVEDLCDRDKSLIYSVGFVLQQLREGKSEKNCDMDGQSPNTESPDSDLCKAGWTKNNSFCYKVFDELANFYQANSSCISEGAGLVWIEDFDELHFLDTILDKGRKYSWV